MIKNIQFLRFVAAALVIASHAPLGYFGLPITLTRIGGFGVDIFFVISGFIIPYILYGGLHTGDSFPKIGAWQFFIRRFVRIWPLYFIVTMLAMLCIPLTSSGWFKPNPDLEFAFSPLRYDVWMVIRSLTFSRFPESPALAVGWTLQFEFIFYALLALLLACSVKKLETLIFSYAAIMLVAIIFLGSVFVSYKNLLPVIEMIGSPMMVEFLFGMILYRLASKQIFLNKYIAAIILLASIPFVFLIELKGYLLGFAGSFYRPIIWGSIAFLIVWSALGLEGVVKAPKVFETLGNASYSLYLIHWVLLPWFTHFVDILGLYDRLGITGVLVSFFLISQAVALAVHFYVELPMTKRLYFLAAPPRRIASTVPTPAP